MGFFESILDNLDEYQSEYSSESFEKLKYKQYRKRKGNIKKRRNILKSRSNLYTTEKLEKKRDTMYTAMSIISKDDDIKFEIANKDLSIMRGVVTYSKIPYKIERGGILCNNEDEVEKVERNLFQKIFGIGK